MGDENKAMTENAFDIHDRATTASRVGRVRQIVTADQLVSEVDLEVGFAPGLPFRVKGTVITTASLKAVSAAKWETQIEGTEVKGSNVPFVNQILDDINLTLPVGDVYRSIRGDVPIVPSKTFYVDEGMRITRDVDDNFFVYTRA